MEDIFKVIILIIGMPTLFLVSHGVLSYLIYKWFEVKVYPWWGFNVENYEE